MYKSRVGALILLTAVLSGCGGASDIAPAATGTLSIQVAGLDTAIAETGTVTIMSTDAAAVPPVTRGVPPGGVVQVPLPVGTYRVTYHQPAAYNVVSISSFNGTTAVTVTQNATTVLQFGVRLVPGSIGLVADVANAPFPADAGTASIVRIGTPNAPEIKVTIPYEATEGYYRVVTLPPGTYRVIYHPPDGYDLTPGFGYEVSDGAATYDISVQSNQSQWVCFEIVNKSP